MYFHAWKQGLKTTYYLRSRPATRIAKTTVETAATRQQPTPARGRLLAREPRELRGLPVSRTSTRPARLLDPGLCLTLRPMALPEFFEMYRGAIKNTWTVEEVDFATDVARPARKMTPAERHLIQRLVAFFATGDSIVANNLVLNLYKHINAPEARMYLSRQLYEEALHVQFYLTLLDTYVPDPEERAPRLRGGREHPVDPQQGRVLHASGSTRSTSSTRLETRERPPAVPAEPDLLRGLHRGAVLLRRVRLRLLPALARACCTAWPAARTGCSATRARTWRSPSRSCSTVRREEPELFDAELERERPRDARRGDRVRERSSPRTCSAAASPACRSRDMRQYLEYCADQRLATLGHAEALRREEPVRLHGPAGRPGGDELLRAPRLGLPGRREGEVVLDAAF